MRLDNLLVSVVVVAAVAACGGDGSAPVDSDASGDAEGADTAAAPCECGPDDGCGLNACGAECGGCADGQVCLGGACEAATACDREGFSAFIEQASLVRVEGEGATLEYRADSRASVPFERLVIQSYERLGGPVAPGTYPITTDGYADCSLCVLAYQGCTQAGCARTFLADAGAVAIEEISGGRFEATVRAAHFREVYVNDSTLESTPLPAGERWCVERFEADTSMTEESYDDTCFPDGTGALIGDKIADFALSTCDGQPTSLHALCGARAVWVVLSAGWCSSCAAHVPEVGAAWEAKKDLGLEALIVLGEDTAGEVPTPAYCQQYASEMGVDPSLLYIPAAGFETVGEHIELYSDGSLGLPWDGVLDGKNMRYIWAQTHDGGSANSALDDLLGK